MFGDVESLVKSLGTRLIGRRSHSSLLTCAEGDDFLSKECLIAPVILQRAADEDGRGTVVIGRNVWFARRTLPPGVAAG